MTTRPGVRELNPALTGAEHSPILAAVWPKLQTLIAPRRARGFASVAAVVLAGCATLPPHPVAEKSDALMRDLAARNLFQGAVVMGRGGRIEYAAGFGFADQERQVPFTPDTPTDGASIAKTFTAAAMLKLVTERRLDLETPVRDVLPAYPHAGTRVRHLLAHSAGLHDYDWLDPRATRGRANVKATANAFAIACRIGRTYRESEAIAAPVPQWA